MSVAPREESRKMSRRCRRKKIDLWTTESATDAMEGLWREMPIRRRPETRCRVREKVLLRWNEDGENTEAQGMGEEKHFPGEKKKRERYRATFSFHIGDSRRAVRPPEEIACVDGWGKEDPEEDDEGHELLGIDMGWGIHNVLPETLKQTSLEINTPALVRRIRRHLQVTILDAERPHWSDALGRLQRGYPRQIPNRLLGQEDREIDVLRQPINRVEIALEKAGMKTDEGNGGDNCRQMAEENLKPATRHGAGSHRSSAGDERGPLVLVDGDRRRRRVPKETEEAECLRWNQRRLRVIDDEADALNEE